MSTGKSHKEVEHNQFTSQSLANDTSQEKEMNYMQLCAYYKLKAWDHTVGEDISKLEKMGYCSKAKLPAKEIQKAIECELPDGSHYKYFVVEKSSARITGHQLLNM